MQMRLYSLIAGISMAAAAAANNVTLVGSGQNIVDKALRVRQEVTSGGFGTFVQDVASGGFGTLDSTTANQQLSTIVGALLMKGNEQTLCEVVMMTTRVGVVAASCLDYVGGSVDPNASYGVGLSKNVNDIYGNLKVETIIPHPDYNPDTFENNIAVVMGITNPAYDFENKIADWPLDWTNYYFVHRSQTEGPAYLWNVPTVSVTNGTNSINMNLNQCTSASALYNANQDKFICSPLDITYYYDRSCNIPYGGVYMGHDGTVAAAAVYSHSSIYGDGSFCGTSKMVHYYTILRDYIKWIEQQSGQTVPVYHSANPAGYTASSNAGFTMNAPSGPDAADVHVFGKFNMDKAAVDSSSETMTRAILNSVSSNAAGPDVASGALDLDVPTVTETSTEVSTAITTEITTEATTVVTTELTTSTSLATSTTVETSSTTETSTTTVQVTDLVTATVTATAVLSNDPMNPTATLIITPQFYTQSITVHDTITQTVTENAANQPSNGPPNSQENQVDAEAVTKTETETITETEHNTVIQTSSGLTTISADQGPTTITETVVSTVVNNVSVDTPTTTLTVTAVPEAHVITSYITITDMHMGTATSVVPTTVNNNKNNDHETDAPVESLDSMSESASAETNDSSSPSKAAIGIIIALVILLLIICCLIYYFCIYRKKKQQRALQGAYVNNAYVNEGHRVDRWVLDRQMGRVSYMDAPPEYVSSKVW